MKFRIFAEPQQGAGYQTLRNIAVSAEELGFDAFFRSDHYLKMGDVSGLPGPSDAWITLGGLARETSRIRLGTLVTAATFRNPGPLAISVAQVDQMSGGRVELGIGAGWYEAEHAAYALPFPALGERFERYEEQLAIITGLWGVPDGEKFQFSGKHYTVTDSPGLPKPAQRPGPPGEAFGLFRAACAAAGRAEDSMIYSAAQAVACGRTPEEVARRAAAIGRDPQQPRVQGLGGCPAEIADKLGTFAELGTQTMYLQVMDLQDLDHLELLAELID